MPDEDEVINAIVRALDKHCNIDADLLVNDANERSLTHRVAMYLQSEVDEWNQDWFVDCEYNRVCNQDNIDPKRLDYSESLQSDETNAKTVFPNIIVHKRRVNGEEGNLLVAEFKKSTNQSAQAAENDIKKLKAFLEQLHYRYAYFIELKCGNASPTYPPEPGALDGAENLYSTIECANRNYLVTRIYYS